MRNKIGIVVLGILCFASAAYAASFTTDGLCLRSGMNKVCLVSGTLSADLDFTLPTADGNPGEAVVTDGAGNLSFSPAGSGGGLNYVTNPGAENDLANITDADSILTRNTLDTPVLKGLAQFEIDADASGEKACWALDTLQGEIEGNAIGAFDYRGDASKYKAYVYNNTDSVNASFELVLSNAATKAEALLNFIANPAKTYLLCMEATDAAAAAFVADSVSVERWDGVGSVAQAETMLQLSRTGQNFLNTSVNVLSNAPVISINPYSSEASGVYTAPRAGRYLVTATTRYSSMGSGFISLNIQKNSANISGCTSVDDVLAEGNNAVTCVVDVVATDTIRLTSKTSSDTNYDVTVTSYTITRFPTASEQVLRIGAPGSGWTAWTPTFVGLGTPTSVDLKYQCSGSTFFYRGSFTTGTTTGVAASISLPTGYSAQAGAAIAGSFGRSTTASDKSGNMLILPATDSTKLYFAGLTGGATAVDGISASNGNSNFAGSQGVFVSGFIPVTADSPCPSASMPLVKHAVTTPSEGVEAVLRLNISGSSGVTNCTTASCTVETSNVPGATSARASAGTYTITWPAGTLSAKGSCSCSSVSVGAGGERVICTARSTTATNVNVTTIREDTSAASDTYSQVQCTGPR